MSTNPLDSIVFITLPDEFLFPAKEFVIEKDIPLPVQLTSEDTEQKQFDTSTLTLEKLLAGILSILAYDTSNKNIEYYKRFLIAARPEIKKELTEAAILKAKNEDFDIAEEIFSALRGLDPNDLVTLLNTALFYDERGSSYRRSGLNEDADACDETASTYYKRSLSVEQPLPDAYFNAAFFYLKQKNYARTRECFEIYLTLIDSVDEKDMSDNEKYKKERAKEIIQDISSRNLEDELFNSAYEFIQMGQEEKALEKIRDFIEKNPKVWNAWFMLGWALRKLERWDDACTAFNQAIDCGGRNCDTFNELAICLIELNDFDGARKNLYEALKIEPENTKIMSNLGFLALREGCPSEARRYFATVLEFDPNDEIAKKALEDME